MCGIAGFTWESEEQILGMCRALAHRGPDDEGIRVADGVSLGHRRLAVLDLSSAGHNPLPSDDERYWVVHNGEIYNFIELREELKKAGRSFRSDTDTEVIANAFAEWGPQCVERFHGMFAFAVFDTRRKELFLARDRIGIKPLYFAAAGDRFAFASELKALLECPHVSRELDPQSLLTFMGFEFVASPRSIFRDIRSLPPAHMIRVSSRGECEIWRYWDLSWTPKFTGDRSEGEAALLDCLRDSVKERLRSDVPVGVFLSGGIDSSALVALMAEQMSEAIPAFTLAYEDESFSELHYAESVAKRFHLEHHVLKIEPITPEIMVEAIWHLDQPMADLSALPFFLISEVARERVTVALSGEGGDEIFAGYDRFRAAQLERLLRPFGLDWARRQFGPWIQSLEDRPEKKGPINMLRRFVEGLELPSGAGAMRWQHFLTGTQAETLFRPEVLERMDLDRFAMVIEHRDESGATDPIDLDLAADLSFTMPDSLLMKVDKMSMARGLEVRVPFLDHRLVELAARFPSDWKLHRMETKSILRSACASLLPGQIVRRGKQGYSLPVKNWLRGEMQPFAREVFDRSQLISRYFQKEAVESLWNEHNARRANHNHLLWSLLNASLWHERFVEQREVPR